MKNSIDEINNRVLRLFDAEPKIALLPMLYDKIPSNLNVLFMGINPSFDAKRLAGLCNKSQMKVEYHFTEKSVESIHKKNARPRHLDEIIKIQSCAKLHGAYFKPFRKFAERKCKLAPCDWDHIDLFFERNTDYKNMRVFRENFMLSNFGFKQLKATKMLLEFIQPRNLIIANRLASTIFSIVFAEWMTYDTKHRYGTLCLPRKSDCRVFFSLQWGSPRPKWKRSILRDQKLIIHNLL